MIIRKMEREDIATCAAILCSVYNNEMWQCRWVQETAIAYLEDYFESKEEAYNEGFFYYHTPNWFINYYVPMSGTGSHMSVAVYTVNENVLLCEFECNLENIVCTMLDLFEIIDSK